MSRKTITLEVDDHAQEERIRNSHALIVERNDLALTAPAAAVIDQLEDLVIERGRETLRASLQQAVQKRLDDAEKKGRRSGTALAAKKARTEAKADGN